jgi:sulfite reductase (NADPH) flavoprotein alpha-component
MNNELKKLFPITPEQQELAQKVITNFQESELLWFSGFLAGYVSGGQKNQQNSVNGASPEVKETLPTQVHLNGNGHLNGEEKKQLTVLFGTHTGNSRKVADLLLQKASAKGIQTFLADLNDYNPKNLKSENNLAVIVSTHGEGEPPLAAEEFYNFIHSNRAPKLEHLNFSVLALGDKSYAQFCKTGQDIDKKLSELGGKRLIDRHDCDVDFLPVAETWVNALLGNFNGAAPAAKPVNGVAVQPTVATFSKANPFEAEILEKIKLNGKGSAKETYHFEISLQGSGLVYKPGDALGVVPVNSDSLVDSLLSLTGLASDEKVTVNNVSVSLHDALKYQFEIGILSRDTIEKHNQFAKSQELTETLADVARLTKFTFGADVYDLFKSYPFSYSAPEFVGILRKLQPRLYSISSAYEAYPEEVHVTAAALRYTYCDRSKDGTCSGFLADSSKVGDKIKVFIEANEAFRLPEDNSAPVIMIGPGTGVAPFRAFAQYRAETGSKGKNWLFFGDQHFTTDFLYQSEWLDYKKKGLLTKLSVAFSRDQRKKIYVQHKLKEQSAELVKWIDEGAFIYVCGDMKHMAKDVLNTFVEIIAEQKQIDPEQAREFVQHLRKSKRYREDVY